MKYIFALMVLIHGFIHFMGFAKAFGYGNITQITKEITKPAGACWMITAFLFIAVTILFLIKKDTWPLLAIVTVIISQVLIIGVWKDAKFGTIANIIILLVTIPAFAEFRFNKKVKKEITTMLSAAGDTKTLVNRDLLNGLPPIVQQWLTYSGIVDKERVQTVRLKQKGEMLTKPDGKWLPFTATQYFTIDKPAFNWQADVKLILFVNLNGRDKFENGEGEMLIKAASLVTIVNEGHNTQMNESTMLRYLAETCWFPSAALSDYIKWEAIDSLSAKATMSYKGISVSGIFRFNRNGDVVSFEGKRFYKIGKQKSMETWFIENSEYKAFSGMRIPSQSKVIWKFREGDYHWLSLEITELEYNRKELFQ